jgi:hypothetical protein
MLVHCPQGIARRRRLFGALLATVLLLPGCLPLRRLAESAPPPMTRGSIQRVTHTPFVFEPYIAVHPTNPAQLAAIAIAVRDRDCRFPPAGSCAGTLVLGTSADGGATWQEQSLLATQGDGVVAFDPAGTLHIVGLLGQDTDRAVFYHRGVPGPVPNYQRLALDPAVDKPWLTIDPATGGLYVPYVAPTQADYASVFLRRSTDAGATWSPAVMVDRGPRVLQEGRQVALPAFNPQVLLASDATVAVVWTQGGRSRPPSRTLWLARSSDGGQTFAAAQQLSEASSEFSSTFAKGVAYVLYQREAAPAQLVLARSDDGAATWTTTIVGGDLPHHVAPSPPPAISVAPNGTLDIVFYAPTDACIDQDALEAYLQQRLAGQQPRWIDSCQYHVYYTWSTDGGASFQPPQRLTDQPIAGESFVQIQQQSRPGEYIGIAATDTYAYPIWIAGTHAYTTQIRR